MKDLRKLLLLSFVLSGIAALIYQITWIRPLQFLLGSTTYVISIILAAFMGGLALGSWYISKRVDKIKNLPKTYGLMELGIGLYGVLLLSIFNLLPKVYNALYSLHGNFYFFMGIQFVLVFIVLLIPTTLMGATFPVVAKYYSEKIGKGIGEVYSANNLGAIIGSFGVGFILIPLLGIKASIIFAATINLVVAGIILSKSDASLFKKPILVVSVLALFLVLAYFGNYNIQQMHSGGFYRTEEVNQELGPVVYYEEGLYATITVRDILGKGKALFINGKPQGSTGVRDLRVNFLLAYLPQLINPVIENVLVIGLGTGTTSGQLAQTTQVTTVEIESKVLDASHFFKTFNLDVLNNLNHEIIIDDGRNYLLKNNEKYDAIIQEPSDPWQSFSTPLYSKEFFELVKEDLNEDGLFVKWIPIYTMSADDFRNFYKTFSSVFPHTLAFVNIRSDEDTPVKFETSEIILVGSKQELIVSEKDFIEHYDNFPSQAQQQLSSLRLSNGTEIYNLLLFRGEDMKGYADTAQFITDDNLLLEFSTAKNVLSQQPVEVLKDIIEEMNGRR